MIEAAEAAVDANPDDEGAWQVYADALQSAGDPRGELMAVQTRLASGADGAALERERALIEVHAETWLFEGVRPLLCKTRLAGRREGEPLRIEWKHGFPAKVTIEGTSHRSSIAFEGLGETWRALCSNPRNMRFVRSIVFDSEKSGDEASWSECVTALLEYPPPWLRALSFNRGDYWDISSTSIYGLDAQFWKAVPRLEELTIELGEIELADIDAPRLKKFSIVSGGFDGVDVVTTAKWPQLEHLSLFFGREDYGGLEEPGPVEQLLSSAAPSKLKHLGLCNATFADELPAMVLTSKWLAQLESLDLSRGTMGDEGARVLLANAERLQHLKSIDLSRGFFSKTVLEDLRAAFRGVVLERLESEAVREERYVSLSE